MAEAGSHEGPRPRSRYAGEGPWAAGEGGVLVGWMVPSVQCGSIQAEEKNGQTWPAGVPLLGSREGVKTYHISNTSVKSCFASTIRMRQTVCLLTGPKISLRRWSAISSPKRAEMIVNLLPEKPVVLPWRYGANNMFLCRRADSISSVCAESRRLISPGFGRNVSCSGELAVLSPIRKLEGLNGDWKLNPSKGRRSVPKTELPVAVSIQLTANPQAPTL